MRVLFFGSSITQGFWDLDGGYVARIRKHYDKRSLQDLEHDSEQTIFNLGVSADTSENVLARYELETTARVRHGVKLFTVVEIGINDSMLEAGKEKVSPEQYKQNLSEIIKSSKSASSGIIFVGLSACDESLTTPASWGDYVYTNERIEMYENAMREVAEQHDIFFIPIYGKFKAALDSGESLLADGLHPNEAGHQFMADIILKQLDEQLQKL